MKQGTVSVLFGCHSVIHSWLVIRAWKKVHGSWPRPWEVVCILLHDIGHWGTNYLDNYEEKRNHARFGARIAYILFGDKGYQLVIGHNSYLGAPKSDMYMADKVAYTISPMWWLWTTCLFEPRLVRKGLTRWQSARMFKEAAKENIRLEEPREGHDIYLEQVKEYNNGTMD